MIWMGPTHDTRTENERYLQDEIDRYREAEERRYRQEQHSRELRDRERKRQFEDEMRQADTWPEALGKQICLFNHEAMREEFPEERAYWENSADACRAALDLWATVSSERQAELDKLRARIESIEDEIRLEVAARLEASTGTMTVLAEFRQVAEAIRTEDPSDWLYW